MSRTSTRTALPEWQRSAKALRAHWLAAVAKGLYPYAFFRELALPPRLLRLFAVACCRHPLIDGLLTDPRSSTAVEVAERHADGLCTDAALRQAWHDGWAARDDIWGAATVGANAAAAVTAGRAATVAANAANAATVAANAATDTATGATGATVAAHGAAARARAAMCEYQGGLLVSLVGPGWKFAPGWRTDTAVALAWHIYEAREWGAMPILADALQDAGCEDTLILEPLRDPAGVWFRGCRLLDELLGKREGRDRA